MSQRVYISGDETELTFVYWTVGLQEVGLQEHVKQVPTVQQQANHVQVTVMFTCNYYAPYIDIMHIDVNAIVYTSLITRPHMHTHERGVLHS